MKKLIGPVDDVVVHAASRAAAAAARTRARGLCTEDLLSECGSDVYYATVVASAPQVFPVG
jgi:hypothetical protein